MNETKKPAVRFKGFSDEWEQQKFNDILEKYEDPVATPHDGYERLGVRSHAKGTFHSYVAPGAELETAQMHRVAANKMLFNITFAWEHAVAITDEMDAGKLVSHRFPQFSFNPEMSPKFFKYVISNEKFRYHLWLSSPGGAGRNRVLNIPEMLKYQTYLPEKSEQELLADWFIHLDELIEQHQSKLEKLQSLKASMLEKMFPKDGADVPKIRFKGFTGAWEQVKIGDIAEIITGGTPNTERQEYWEPKEIPWLSSGEIHKKRITFTNDKISGLGFEHSSARLVKPNSLLIALAGQGKTRGTVAITRISLTTNQSIAAIYFKNTIVPDFALANLEGRYNEIRMRSSGDGARGGLNKQLVSEIEIPYPFISEQKKIAMFFEKLDHLITIHQQELDKFQSIKKALLEKMFV